MHPTLSFIIPNYNGAQILKQNLPKILPIAQKHQAPVIIIDDFSTDNSIAWLTEHLNLTIHHPSERRDPSSQQFPAMNSLLVNEAKSIILITKKYNQGFSSTVNLGVAHATTDLVFLLNSDAVPHQDAIDFILPYFQDPKTFAVGLKDLDDDSQAHGQGKFIWHQGFLLHNKVLNIASSDLRSQISDLKLFTGWVSCGSGLFRRSIWNELGGLDTLYNPFYFEDVDLGYRSWKAGYHNYFEPRALCDHLHDKGAIKSNYQADRIRAISIRNQFLFTWLNLTDRQLITKHLIQLPKNILIAIKNNDQPFLRGLIEATKKLSEVVSHRHIRQKYKSRNDQQLLQLVS